MLATATRAVRCSARAANRSGSSPSTGAAMEILVYTRESLPTRTGFTNKFVGFRRIRHRIACWNRLRRRFPRRRRHLRQKRRRIGPQLLPKPLEFRHRLRQFQIRCLSRTAAVHLLATTKSWIEWRIPSRVATASTGSLPSLGSDLTNKNLALSSTTSFPTFALATHALAMIMSAPFRQTCPLRLLHRRRVLLLPLLRPLHVTIKSDWHPK